ncbi:hypothetical protein IM543_15965 [Massilia sp. UMI-21]|nr:hypothetical protein IM543_15965 [Massilia sp. UMI-21]
MSIAMTVVIAPSRRLRCLLAGFGASLLAAACAAGLPACAGVSRYGGFAAAPLVAAALLLAGLCVLHAALGPAMVHRIDISGVGRLRLTVQQGVRTDACEAFPARLLPGSTLWPWLMLLRLETAPGPAPDGPCGWFRGCMPARRKLVCRNVVILPDSVPPAAMRALAVALGGAGGAGGTSGATSTTHKIL